MIEAVYCVPVSDRCPVCGGPMRAVYYRIKGLQPFVFCWRHGFGRNVTREEHRKFMAEKIAQKNPTASERGRAFTET